MGRTHRLRDWLDHRTGYRGLLRVVLDEPVAGGASFAYVFGSVLTFLLLLQAVTGVALAFTYSPSATDAWASVAYLQDQVTLGWFIRGLHAHGASAMVIVAGLHMLQTAVWGAYKKPRELNWIIGVLLLALILAFALTGYLLPWDQKGYWATKVATGIAGTSPVLGESLQAGIQGGNEYGNLTLTRFFALHVFVLPATTIGLLVAHIALFRRHGVTPHWWRSPDELARRAQPFWPDQLFKDVVAMAVALAVLVGLNVASHGVELGAPADPSSNFDARPEWYFRALFQALKYFEGPMETVVALGIPPIVGGLLIGLPFLDRSTERDPRRRLLPLAALAAVVTAAGILTLVSFREDASDPALQERLETAERDALLARELAGRHGVPAAGGTAVFSTAPHHRAKEIWAEDCAACHEGDARQGPEIGPGYGSRAWIREFLLDPQGPRFFGATTGGSMPATSLRGEALDAVVELVYAQSGAGDVDAALAKKGQAVFDDESCSDCHTIDERAEGDPGPNLFERGTPEALADLIGHPASERWFGADTEMPSFRDEYNRAERLLLGQWIASLRGQAHPGGPKDPPSLTAEPGSPE